MLVAVVVAFALCWFPIHLFQMLVWFFPDFNNQKTKLSYYTYVGSYFLAHWLSMVGRPEVPYVRSLKAYFFPNLGTFVRESIPVQLHERQFSGKYAVH